ncbi:hypothetical protein FHU41_001751 [Psychromicrobium silvestre]|uniref:Uncharacterized protein n=1 Tax=Psychromicrobium silvestre TaxID=1645614 RepID=A0A7Y9LTV1_9MICC|nr:hypothetical protein [Psychromicrobium silvestre]NYE95501.1 hypothetical protein [Psychromicrobium silvestre]
MSTPNYPPPGGYPDGSQGYGGGRPNRTPPPIPRPGAGYDGQPPYPGQPDPGPYQGQQYGGPQYPDQQYRSQQYGNQQQGFGGWQPTPPKKKFPTWGWFAIGVPLLGIIVLVTALIATNLPKTPVADPSSKTQTPVSAPLADSSILLSAPAPYKQAPVWGTETPSDWTPDQGDVTDGTRYKNSVGCYLLLSTDRLFSTDLGASDKSSDQLATLSWAVNTVQSLKKEYPDAKEEASASFASVSMDKLGGTKLQFYPKTVSYTNSNGIKVRLQMAYRAMPGTSSVLIVGVVCKSSVPAISSGWTNALDNIYVTG